MGREDEEEEGKRSREREGGERRGEEEVVIGVCKRGQQGKRMKGIKCYLREAVDREVLRFGGIIQGIRTRAKR